MKIFVAGGTGFVGKHLIPQLLSHGHTVRLLVHTRTSQTFENVECFAGDVTSPADMETGAEGCDAIINLVGIIREFQSRGVTFERLHIQATENLVAAARCNGISRYLQMSALGTRPDAVSEYHRTKYRGEEIVRASQLSWTIFRPSLIYGLHDAFVTMLASQLRLFPVIPVIGDGMYRLQPIHADDVSSCFARAFELPATIGQIYELCGKNRMSYCELLDVIATVIGRRIPIKVKLPLGLMQIIIPAMQKIPQFPITSDQLQMLLEENICNDCSWHELFGVEPEAFSDNIREYLL